MSRDPARTYSTAEVATMTGASYRMLDYACRMGRIPGQPAGAAHGSGTPRRWTEDDVLAARRLVAVSWLRNESIENVVQVLQELGALGRIQRELADREAALGRPKELTS